MPAIERSWRGPPLPPYLRGENAATGKINKMKIKKVNKFKGVKIDTEVSIPVKVTLPNKTSFNGVLLKLFDGGKRGIVYGNGFKWALLTERLDRLDIR